MRAKRLRIPALTLLLALLASCGALPPDLPAEGIGRAVRAEQAGGAEDAAEADPEKQTGHEIFGMTVTEEPAFEAVPGDGSEEIDLTGLSTAVLYATVGKMNGSPEPYAGKTVRMAGYFTAEQTGLGIRYTCGVPDMAGCCFEYVEIRYAGDPGPDEIPADGTVVTVSGIFGFDRVNEYLHYTFLADAAVEYGQ